MHDLLTIHSLQDVRPSYLIASLAGLVAVGPLPSAHSLSRQKEEMTKPQDDVALPFDNLRDMGIHAHMEPLLRSICLSV
jgi:hypothetical protein